MSAEASSRVYSVDLLRGVAALSVCLFHMSNGNVNFLPADDPVRLLGSYGWAGVEIFFVISGFVIPYSLSRTGYHYGASGTFIMRRLARIHPPYVAAVLLVLVLNFVSTLSPVYKGQPFDVDFYNLALHLGYLNGFFNEPWLNVVFWTLAIEFQYYLLMAAFFPLLVHPKETVRWLILGAFLVLGYAITEDTLIFSYLLYFIAGISVFLYRTKGINTVSLCVIGVLDLLAILATHGWLPFFATALAAGILLGYRRKPSRPVLFLATISYSLYLVHVPVGGRVINLSINFVQAVEARYIVLLMAVSVSCVFAYVFYRLFERPALRLSWRIGAGKRPAAATAPADA